MTGTKVTYEWILEVQDAYGDIEPEHCSSYKECLERSKEHEFYEIVLVRDLGGEDCGLLDREWSYVDQEGNFDRGFARPVPKRFLKEVTACHS